MKRDWLQRSYYTGIGLGDVLNEYLQLNQMCYHPFTPVFYWEKNGGIYLEDE